ncbi:MAG: hypothetical protein A4E36_00604 [Methanoregulaceae archaeon PtaB.Bin009]|jgi:hypothetical protein|nr:MAG: hypothetical protein A4E36_00604 [Methanoregulaceae archaeon PtaB.Bin009]OPY38822.1 MAG: hypothetical protein A4E41_01836 [Methanoregulaceae archaeon PtaU1.Bin066]
MILIETHVYKMKIADAIFTLKKGARDFPMAPNSGPGNDAARCEKSIPARADGRLPAWRIRSRNNFSLKHAYHTDTWLNHLTGAWQAPSCQRNRFKKRPLPISSRIQSERVWSARQAGELHGRQIMEEKRGKFVKGAWIEEEQVSAKPGDEVKTEPIDQRIDRVTSVFTTSFQQVIGLARDLVTTPEGHAHIEKQVNQAVTQIERAISDVLKMEREEKPSDSSDGKKEIRIE